MIRIVKLDGQSLSSHEDLSPDKCFAIYDTVRDKFVAIADEQIFDSVDDLATCFDTEMSKIHRLPAYAESEAGKSELTRMNEYKQRCLGLARSAGY